MANVQYRKINLTEFFESYGKAFDDGEKLSKFYGDCALAAAPNFTGCLKGREEIHVALNSVAESQRSTGMLSLSPQKIEVTKIDDLHSWAKVQWSARFRKTGNKQILFDISYLVRENNNSPQILVYVSHQDEQVMRRELGII
ncbi:MAG: hypothetical protein AB7F59_13335 [Bdellovibrionales bacterium]